MLKKIVIGLLVCYLLPLHGEILQVELQFLPGICQGQCGPLLHDQLSKIKGAQSVEVNATSGQAIIKWTPGQRFSWNPINVAVRMVGISLHQTLVTVAGEIRPRGQTLELISSGDGTPFLLIGPITPSQTNYVTRSNLDNRTLSPGMVENLLEGSRSKKIAVIHGPLFMPWRGYSPLYLTVAEISWKEKKK